jgi:hypothetical protein
MQASGKMSFKLAGLGLARRAIMEPTQIELAKSLLVGQLE